MKQSKIFVRKQIDIKFVQAVSIDYVPANKIDDTVHNEQHTPHCTSTPRWVLNGEPWRTQLQSSGYIVRYNVIIIRIIKFDIYKEDLTGCG